MSKKWPPHNKGNPWPNRGFKPDEGDHVAEFMKQQEEKMDADHAWRPHEGPDYESQPIGGEKAEVDPNRRT